MYMCFVCVCVCVCVCVLCVCVCWCTCVHMCMISTLFIKGLLQNPEFVNLARLASYLALRNLLSLAPKW